MNTYVTNCITRDGERLTMMINAQDEAQASELISMVTKMESYEYEPWADDHDSSTDYEHQLVYICESGLKGPSIQNKPELKSMFT